MSQNEYDVIIAKFEDMQKFLEYRMDRIEAKMSNCDDCKNAATFRERFRSQWFHILALWASVVGLGTYLYQHVVGK